MIELALMVIDRLVGLVRAREASNRQLHDDFLAPMVADFERLHQNYVDTFNGYRSSLLAAPDFEALLARIATDVNSTSHLRSKLQALTPLRKDPVFGSLVGTAHAYLATGEMGRHVLMEGTRPIPNAARQRIIAGLRQIAMEAVSPSTKADRGIAVVDEVLGDLQGCYAAFARSALATKRSLLDTRISPSDR